MKFKKVVVVAFLLMLTFNLNINKNTLSSGGGIDLDEHLIDIFNVGGENY